MLDTYATPQGFEPKTLPICHTADTNDFLTTAHFFAIAPLCYDFDAAPLMCRSHATPLSFACRSHAARALLTRRSHAARAPQSYRRRAADMPLSFR